LLYALSFVVLITKSERVNRPAKKGQFHIYSKSPGPHGDDDCVIKVNRGGNLCRNRPGHNVVVVDPVSLNYQSVSFDTRYMHNKGPQMMIEFLESVKPNSLIVIAVRGLSYFSEETWTCKTIKYMDSFGSKTYNATDNNELNECFVDELKGCPIAAEGRSWTLLTQKRPMLNERERLLPDWTTCAYNKGAIYLETVIDKTVNVALPCSAEAENFCSNDISVTNKTNFIKTLDGEVCLKENDCKITKSCLPDYTDPELNTGTFICNQNGNWRGTYFGDSCPSCRSIFGLFDKYILDKSPYYVVRSSKISTFKFEVTADDPYMWQMGMVRFHIKLNDEPYEAYWPMGHRFVGQNELLEHETYNVTLSDVANLQVFKNKAYGKKYNVVLHLQTEGLAYDETYNFELQVVVVKRITKVDYQRPDTKNDYKTKHLLHKFNKKIIIR